MAVFVWASGSGLVEGDGGDGEIDGGGDDPQPVRAVTAARRITTATRLQPCLCRLAWAGQRRAPSSWLIGSKM
jgi:hypothetical protein